MLSTPVGALGSGLGGGVELTLRNIAIALQRRGHHLKIVAPSGSILPEVPLVEIDGLLQVAAQTQDRTAPIVMQDDSILVKMWHYAHHAQTEYDVMINFAYDWLPFYLTPFFNCPIAHLVSMGSLTDAMDHAIQQIATEFPGTIGVHSHAQAATFPFAEQCHPLGNGLDLVLYDFCEVPDNRLAWVGRIAPEKGLEDAIAAAQQVSLPLHIWGAIQDEAYWQTMRQIYPDAAIQYGGFLTTEHLQRSLGRCRGLLMTPKWIEAFGNVAIEALACGVPVITYRRGGPAEIVESGKTGWLVEPDSIDGLVEAIARLDDIDRQTCRHQAEQRYSLDAMGDRVETWLRDIIQTRKG